MPANPRDFLLNTDYEMDKIVFFKQGSFTTSVEITHNLGYAPLAFGVWSTNSNFSSVNTLGSVSEIPAPPGVYQTPLNIECSSNDTIIRLKARGEYNGETIYYRVYAFEPSDITANAPSTSQDSNTFIFNTDYNYRKLFHAGEFTLNNLEYTHNLGYIPQVMGWAKYSFGGQWTETLNFASNASLDGLAIKVTSTKLKAQGLRDTVTEKMYWRIYYDEA